MRDDPYAGGQGLWWLLAAATIGLLAFAIWQRTATSRQTAEPLPATAPIKHSCQAWRLRFADGSEMLIYEDEPFLIASQEEPQ